MVFSDSKNCPQCNKSFFRKTTGSNRNSKAAWAKRIYCSVYCRAKSLVLSGDKNPNWKGGGKKCIDCGTLVVNQYAKRCKPCFYIKNSGTSHNKWNNNKTLLQSLRQSKAYRVWRKEVYERDNYTCVMCKDEKSKLNADHIYPIALYPEHAFDINNGRTLCISCHKKTDTWGYGTVKIKQAYGL